MSFDFVGTVGQYWEAIVATSALIISTLSLLRDKRSRQMDMLHSVFQDIGNLNIEIANYNSSERDEEQIEQDLEIIKKEKLKEFDYLCYLLNRKKAREKEVYDLGGEDVKDFYERYKDDMDDSRYSDIERVVKRWETYPPTSKMNRLILWLKKTWYNLFA
ncbi:hypothetical protein [Halobellus limi]|nr:hypothetical protein [Halobellus limi]